MSDTNQVYDVRTCVLCELRYTQCIEQDNACPECGGYSDREFCYRISHVCPQHGPVAEVVEPELL